MVRASTRLGALGALCALVLLQALSAEGDNSQIHRHMSIEDLRRLFQVESHDQVPEYEVVRLVSRVPPKNDAEPTTTTASSAPQSEVADVARVVSLSAFGRQHELRLRPTEGLFKRDQPLRVFLAEPGNGTDVHYAELPEAKEHIGETFQDEENEAAILMHRDADGTILLEGTIGQDLVVKPVPASVRQHLDSKSRDPLDDEMFLDEEDEDFGADEVVQGFPLGKESNSDVQFEPGRRRLRRSADHHAHIVYKRAGAGDLEQADLSDYAYMEPDVLPTRGSRSRRSIVKREAPYVIYPEILVIVDYDGYRLHGGDNVQIKRYFVSFWNGVDLRYKLLKGPRIRISIAGIIISRGRDATPYLERNRVGRDAIDSAAALTDMGKYLFRERRLPVYDIAVAVTKLDMCRRQYPNDACNRGTAGFAYVGGACVVNKRLEKVNSVAIIEDTGGFSGIIVAAHEVGHLLGAVHDGSPPPSYLGGPGAEKCRWEDGYIMSDLRHTEKGFKWSPCTVASFHHFLNGDTATCLYNSPHEDESLPRVLPGKLLTLDAQCRKDRGTSACFKDDRVCAQLFCFDSGSGYCVAYRPAAEGSPCGDGQYCMNGKCVVEHENIIPDYSQNTPAFLRRLDDDGLATQPRPYFTYNLTTQRSEWADFWNERLNDISTTPRVPDTYSHHIPSSNSPTYYTPPSKSNENKQTTQNYNHLNNLQNNPPATKNPYESTTQSTNPTAKIVQQYPTPTTQKSVYTLSTTKSPYDFSNFGKTNPPVIQAHNSINPVPYVFTSTVKPNLYEDYYKTSTAKQNLYEDYYKTSTTDQNWIYNEYYRTSTSKPNLYDEYYRTSMANQNIYEEFYRTSTPSQYEDYYKTSTTGNPQSTQASKPNEYEDYYRTYSTPSTTRNPYDFSDFGKPNSQYSITQNPYNQYHSTTSNPYLEYELYYKTSTAQSPNDVASATSRQDVVISPVKTDSPSPIHALSNNSTIPAGDTSAGTCVDRVQIISDGLSCREFLERYGYYYCGYKFMQDNCCASQRQVCPPSR